MLIIKSEPIKYTLTFNQGTSDEVNVSWSSYEQMPEILKQRLMDNTQVEFQEDFAAIVSGIMQIGKPSADNDYDAANSLLYGMETLIEYYDCNQLHKIFDWLRGCF